MCGLIHITIQASKTTGTEKFLASFGSGILTGSLLTSDITKFQILEQAHKLLMSDSSVDNVFALS
jgi:hypothetical protein